MYTYQVSMLIMHINSRDRDTEIDMHNKHTYLIRMLIMHINFSVPVPGIGVVWELLIYRSLDLPRL